MRPTEPIPYDTPIAVIAPARAARMLDVSTRTVYRLIHAGVLRSIKIGRSRRVLVDDVVACYEHLTKDAS